MAYRSNTFRKAYKHFFVGIIILTISKFATRIDSPNESTQQQSTPNVTAQSYE